MTPPDAAVTASLRGGGSRSLSSVPPGVKTARVSADDGMCDHEFYYDGQNFGGTPGIGRMDFNFLDGSEELNRWMLYPHSNSVDVCYTDGDHDRYEWRFSGVELPQGTTFQEFSSSHDRNTGCIEEILNDLDDDGVPILQAFDLRTRSGWDGDVEKIQIRIRDENKLQLCFTVDHGASRRALREYQWKVRFAIIPSDKVMYQGNVGRNNMAGNQNDQLRIATMAGTRAVMSGFKFGFAYAKDDEVDYIKMDLLDSGWCKVRFSSQQSTNYDWSVDYALISL